MLTTTQLLSTSRPSPCTRQHSTAAQTGDLSPGREISAVISQPFPAHKRAVVAPKKKPLATRQNILQDLTSPIPPSSEGTSEQ